MRLRALALASAAALATASPLSAADGDLDPTFVGDGLLVWGTAATDPYPVDALLAPDGALVIVGQSASSNPDGFDWRRLTDSGQESQCGYDPPSSLFARATSAVFDAQGRLIVAGYAQYTSLGWVAAAARFLYPACTLDTDFSIDGYAIVDGASDLRPVDVAFARWWNGVTFVSRIVLLATWGDPLSSTSMALISFRESGTPDTDFCTDGLCVVSWGTPLTLTRPAVLLAAGVRLLLGATFEVAGDGDYWVGAVRADDAQYDTTWAGGAGWLQIDVDSGSDDYLTDMTVDRAGRLLLVGVTQSPAGAGVVRLDAAGEFDPTLDADGRLLLPIPSVSIAATAATVDSAGRLLLAGNTYVQGAPAAGAVRLSDAGALDATYGDGGRALHPIDVYPETDDTVQVTATVLWGGRATLVGEAIRTSESRGFAARLDSALVFRDGFERGSTGGWLGF